MNDKGRGTLPEGVEWPMVDGRPVMPGDVLWDKLGIRHEVMDVMFTTGFMSCLVDMADGGVWVSTEALTRTESEPVLDRDGVPIEVGDTVYKADGSAYTVELVLRGKDGKGLNVRILSKAGDVYGVRDEDLTHEEPESWERLEEDAAKGACAYFGSSEFSCKECLYFGREHDCSGLMAMDIVARAKALAGVGADE